MEKEKLNLKGKMRTFWKNSIAKLKETISGELPRCLDKKYKGHIAAGAVMIFIGITILFTMKNITMCLMAIFLGIATIGLGIEYKTTALKGYKIITGRIIGHSKFFPGRNKADGYILQTADDSIYIPAKIRKEALPVGYQLRVYIEKDDAGYSFRGNTLYGNILGYEVVLEEEEQEENAAIATIEEN